MTSNTYTKAVSLQEDTYNDYTNESVTSVDSDFESSPAKKEQDTVLKSIQTTEQSNTACSNTVDTLAPILC